MLYAVGIDLGGTNIAAGIVNENYEILEKKSVPTGAERPWQEIVADMADLVNAVIQQAGLAATDCVGVGIGSPGTCDSDTGEVVYSNNIRWEHIPLAPEMTRLTGLPCSISNDANCAALGEVVAGAAKGCRNVILITLGTGVGGGIIIDGNIYEGTQSAGAELGHTTLEMGGAHCTCGREGCAEAYASATALIRQATEAAATHPESPLAKGEISALTVYDAMRAGDPVAVEVVANYERYLGETIVNMVNIFRPETLLIGGGVSGEGAPLADRLSDYVRQHCFGGDHSFVTPVKIAALGNRAGIVGAAALRLHGSSREPLKLSPAFKDYLWGGNRLKTDFHKKTSLSPLAESWELSAHPDGPSIIQNGAFAGKTLPEYLKAEPTAAGSKAAGGTFPILIKLIDAARALSIQVHPNDEYAQRVEGEPGKTEMWYIVDAAPDAFLYYGFKHEVTRDEVERRIADGTLTELLNAAPVHKGDVFFIESGTVHAIGAGILTAEIQQSSNTTYRMFDYNRLGADGKPRTLHVQKALDVAHLAPPTHPVGPTEPPVALPDGEETTLAACPYFSVKRLRVSGCIEGTVTADSFVSLLCLNGQGALLYDGKATAFEKGDSLFLPANMGGYKIAGHAELLVTTR